MNHTFPLFWLKMNLKCFIYWLYVELAIALIKLLYQVLSNSKKLYKTLALSFSTHVTYVSGRCSDSSISSEPVSFALCSYRTPVSQVSHKRPWVSAMTTLTTLLEGAHLLRQLSFNLFYASSSLFYPGYPHCHQRDLSARSILSMRQYREKTDIVNQFVINLSN